jgi:hypothetical protein
MKRKITWFLSCVALLFAPWPGGAPVQAQSSGGTYRVDSVAITGGSTLNGGTFQLRGTFGQALAGVSTASGYAVEVGFIGPDDSIFRNDFEYQ